MSPYEVAQRFIGLRELPGDADNPLVVFSLQLVLARGDMSKVGLSSIHDETAWCSGFVNFCCWMTGMRCSWSLMARSWLQVGRIVEGVQEAVPGDIVILQRGEGEQPGPESLNAPGHVGFFDSAVTDGILLLAGNQSNRVSVARFPIERVLGVRRPTI